MNNYQPWEKYHGHIVSSRGGWKIGSGVQNCGYDMMEDLVGKASYMQVVVLNATGHLPTRAIADWLEAIHICLSWPDPRIWCNRIGALAGSNQVSGVTASCLGVLAAESTSYGIKPIISGVEFIEHALTQINKSTSVEDFITTEVKKHGGKPNLMGYARPIAKGDERIPAMEKVTENLGFSVGKHLTLAYQIESTLSARFDESMNINGYVSAFLADQGYSSKEVYRIFSAAVLSGVTACYADTADRMGGSFAPLKTSDVVYKGAKTRTVSR